MTVRDRARGTLTLSEDARGEKKSKKERRVLEKQQQRRRERLEKFVLGLGEGRDGRQCRGIRKVQGLSRLFFKGFLDETSRLKPRRFL